MREEISCGILQRLPTHYTSAVHHCQSNPWEQRRQKRKKTAEKVLFMVMHIIEPKVKVTDIERQGQRYPKSRSVISLWGSLHGKAPGETRGDGTVLKERVTASHQAVNKRLYGMLHKSGLLQKKTIIVNSPLQGEHFTPVIKGCLALGRCQNIQ